RLAAGDQVVVLALGGEGRGRGRGGRLRRGAVAFGGRRRRVLARGVFTGGGGGRVERRLIADGARGRSHGSRAGRRRIDRCGLGRLAGTQQQRKGGRRQDKACEGAEIHRQVPGSWWGKAYSGGREAGAGQRGTARSIAIRASAMRRVSCSVGPWTRYLPLMMRVGVARIPP